MWDGPTMFAARRELEVRIRPGQRQEDSIVPIVIFEVSDLAKTEPVTIEVHDLCEPVRVTCDPHLHC